MKRIILIAYFVLLSTVAASGQDKESIRMGVFLDMTGHTSSFGTATINGIRLATDEINGAGGISGQKLEIFLEDDQGRPELARDVVKKLIVEHKVYVLLGEVASSNTLAAAPLAQEAKIPLISPASTNPQVTKVGDYIFRVCFVDPFQGVGMAKFAFNQLGQRRVAILHDLNSNYSSSLVESFRRAFIEMGGRIVFEQGYTQYGSDYTKHLKSIRKTKPDGIYLPGYYGEVGIIARQARALGIEAPLLGGDGWDSPQLWKLGGTGLKNSFITNHYSADERSTANLDFVAKYKKTYNTEPDSHAALGYDSVYLLADALRRSKATDGDQLRIAIAATKDFSGVTGRLREFDTFRNPNKPVVILKLDEKNSTFVYQSTIQP